MLARWNFPESYADYFRNPHPPRDRPVKTLAQRLVALVDVASEIAADAGGNDAERRARTDALLRAAKTMFDRSVNDLRAAIERGAEDARKHGSSLHGAAPAPQSEGEASAGEGRIACHGRIARDEPVAGEGADASAFVILAEITRSILAKDDINDTLAMVLEGVARTGHFERVFLALLNVRQDHLVGRLGYGDGVAEYVRTLRVPLVPEAGALAAAVLERTPRIVTGGAIATMRAPGAPALPAAAVVVHPLLFRGKAVGVMAAARTAARPALSAAEVTVVQLFCNAAGLALDRAAS